MIFVSSVLPCFLKMETNKKEVKPKKKQPVWSEKEEVTLIIEVLEREHALFGDIKGAGAKSIQRKRQDAWLEIVDVLQSRYTTVKRDVEEVKKKHSNIKQRCKDKIDRIRKAMQQTGGGPAPKDLTPVEATFWERMSHRPSMAGLSCGIDTDAQIQELAKSIAAAASESTVTLTEPAATTITLTEPAASGSKDSVITTDDSPGEVEELQVKSKKRRSQPELTYENTVADTKRIAVETEMLNKQIEVLCAEKAKLEIETSKLISERQCLEAQKLYYQCKIEKEFNLKITFD